MESIDSKLAGIIASEKSESHGNEAMLVAIEGLSNTGKSTLSDSLKAAFPSFGLNALSIEGDKFHYGRSIAMPVYERLVSEIEAGMPFDAEQFPGLIWDYAKMQDQLINPVKAFNKGGLKSTNLVLHGVLTNKFNGTEHDEEYAIDRNSILLVPAIYLHHVPGFDYAVLLDADPEVLIQRKIARAAKINDKRDPALTRKMVELIEYPAMQAYASRPSSLPGVVVDVSDFADMRILPAR